MIMRSFFFSLIFFFLLTQNYAHEIKGIVAFGDSLTCNGNACIHSGEPLPMCTLYPDGRFTDGDVWIEVLSEKLGLERPTPSLAGGLNFAYGGATTGWNPSPNILNVGNQIKDYLERTSGRANSSNLFIIWAGGNDIKNKVWPKKLVPNLRKHIITLANAGAKTFLVPNFPPLGKTPIAESALSSIGYGISRFGKYLNLIDDPDFTHQKINAFIDRVADGTVVLLNYHLEHMLQNLEQSLGITIYRLDAYNYFYAVLDNKDLFGLGPDDELFLYDGFHPSALVHALIAQEAYNAVSQ